MLFAIVLILIGFIFLMKNLGLITGPTWDVIWPILLMALGLSMLLKPKWGWQYFREGKFVKSRNKKDKD
jgi:hypothetical protein